MNLLDLKDVQREIAVRGFATRSGTLQDVSIASLLQKRWSQAPQKHGTAVAQLRPLSQSEAPSRSLSAVHGLGAQPLHTDGAHLRRMPDVIVLHASVPSPTGTAVWKLPSGFPSSLSSGVFAVHGNDGRFLAHAFADSRLRFDPVCMSPSDRLAKATVTFFEQARASAHLHRWDAGNTLLFIDNRRALHGREAVVQEDDAESRLIERATYLLEAP